jgi:hypothetical protein
MSGEEWLARLYCEPKAFWHCTRQLDPPGYYTFNEINYPQYWLRVVEAYTEQKPSPAIRQLHRRVEAARAEFRAKQDKAWGAGRVDRDRYERVEASAWDTFNRQKQAYLRDYLKACKIGAVKRVRPRRKCAECNSAFVSGRAKFCPICAKSRIRRSVKVAVSKMRGLCNKVAPSYEGQQTGVSASLSRNADF